jgi:hypothetical protein
MSRLRCIIPFLCCLLTPPVMADGVLHASSASSRIVFPGPGQPGHLPAPHHLDESTLLLWVTPSVSNSGVRSVLSEEGAFAVELDVTDAVWRIRLEGSELLEVELPFNKPIDLLDTTTLIGCAWDAASGSLEAWAKTESSATVSSVASSSTYETTDSTAGLAIGASADELPAMLGDYGLIVLRSDRLSESDFDAIFESRHYFAPMRMEHQGSAVDAASVRWMLNHSVVSDPDWQRIGTLAWRPALHGQPVIPGSVCVFDSDDAENSLVMAGWIDEASTGMHAMTWTSPFSDGGGDFFIREVPVLPEGDNGVPAPWSRSRPDAVIHTAMRGEPTALNRIIVGGNSRSVRTADAQNLTLPENFAHGFISSMKPVVAGFCNANADVMSNIRGFGFDRLAAPRTTGTIVNIHSWLHEPERSFSRFWTGSPHSQSKGPGSGVILSPQATYALLCRPEAGALMDGSLGDGSSADFELTTRVYMMRFPGAGTVQIRPEASTEQGVEGELGAATSVDLGASRDLVLVLDDQSTVLPPLNEITVIGDHADGVVVNDVCYIKSGPGAGGIAMLDGATFDGTRTTFKTRHWFTVSPGEGSELHIGPWSVEAIEQVLPARPVDDDRIWRGLELTAVGGQVVCFAHDAWRSDVDSGLIIGIAGWAGHGYADQRSHSNPDAVGKMAAAIDADIWLMTLANNQGGSASQHGEYYEMLRNGHAEMSVGWLSCGEHDGLDSQWHRYILNNADDFGVPAVSLFFDPMIGGLEDQCAAGMRSDVSHLSALGNKHIASIWAQRLVDATGGSSDVNADGRVDVLDLLEVISAWGFCGVCPEDVSGDGVVDIIDLLAVLGEWS